MRQVILFRNPAGVLDPDLLTAALDAWERGPGQRGYIASEAHVHPDELPEVLIMCNVSVLPDYDMKPGLVRVSTHEMPTWREFYENENGYGNGHD